ncbi:inducible metalloproteinase inhibitor protein-like [Ctenocephalides felis]|uniref:inducible metalloproteinase inhibitor protein-like n=1 Tax=Ctenocephalides felis TaxID=7515 RepID=UPI000E6E3538|nr:inducible metalloproteinase inhibitor protein-like [Ctenocephalides felis]
MSNLKHAISLCLLFIIVGLGLAQPPQLFTPRDCPENETYLSCGPACQTECATLGQPCYIAYFRCPDGCYCNKGFARNANGACIPIEQC